MFCRTKNLAFVQSLTGSRARRGDAFLQRAKLLLLAVAAAGLLAAGATGAAAAVPPAVTLQPVSQTLPVGAALNLSVTATGTPTLTYQWRLNGTAFPGATSPVLSLFNVQESSQGNYTVLVSNSAGSVTSAVAVVTIQSPPVIYDHGQPQPLTIIQGSNATFTVTAIGDAPLTYQWRFGGTNIAGATNNPLVLTAVQTNQAGSYSVVVSNVLGTRTSSNALLTVRLPPFILLQPAPATQTVVAGSNATFTVLAGGDPTLLYQWRLNGVNVPGATAASLTLTAVQTNQSGNYSVVVSNSFGTATSSIATLDLKSPPTIAAQPQPITVVKGANTSLSVTAGGDGPFAYQWRLGGMNLAGATNNPLLLSGVQTNQAGLYSVIVTSPYGSATSSNAVLTVLDVLAILVQPAPSAALAGENVTFFVGAVGRPSLAYQWFKNGALIVGATNSTLTFTNITAGDVASYNVTVTNPDGSETSLSATLTLAQRALQVVTTQSTSPTTQFTAGTAFSVPVALLAEGGENRVRGSVAYDTNQLVFVSVSTPLAAILTATNAAVGQVGFDLALPAAQTFTAGSNVVAFLNFTLGAGVTQSMASLMLQGGPVTNQVLAATGAPLPCRFVSGVAIFKSLTAYALRVQTGLTEEILPISNPASSVSDLTLVRISFHDLGVDSLGYPIRLMNATGTNAGVPFILMPTPLTAGASFPLLIEYSLVERVRTTPRPRLVVDFVTSGYPATPTGGTTRQPALQFFQGRVFVDFASQLAKSYYIQYSASVLGPYSTSFPGLAGTGGRLRWTDTGPPRTASLPTNGSRFYRVLEVP